jgi:5-oxoprolinase (ATP-hydrolysing)
MAAAVRSISIAQGADPREHTLIGFGGAAGQHICEIADLLEITQVIDPPQAGLLSALGMGLASVKRSYTKPIYVSLDQLHAGDVVALKNDLDRQAQSAFEIESIAMSRVRCSYQLEIRYQGTEGRVTIALGESMMRLDSRGLQEACLDHFCRRHKELFGYVRQGKPLEAIALLSEYSAESENQLTNVNDVVHSEVRFAEPKISVSRDSLLPGQVVIGPVSIQSNGSTTFLEKEWKATVLSDRTLKIERVSRQTAALSTSSRDLPNAIDVDHGVDPVLREVLAQRIAAIAEQMGIVLEQTAISVNVKDRRDFSCAVFAANGDLIANAPHVPVHLGAMSQTIRCLIAKFPSMKPGDCYITNDPYQGGSHLPDITVVTPVFICDGEKGKAETDSSSSHEVDFFVACRAHHAEVGGVSPGSMAPTSTRLGEEGVVIPPMHLVEQGIDRSDAVETLLRTAPYPSRSIAENMADLAAQQAANQRGVQAMAELSRQYGLSVVKRYLEHIQSASEAKTRAWIKTLGDGPRAFVDQMDDGTVIQVCIQPMVDELNRLALSIDFSGTGAESAGNLNANPAIVSAAVIYVIRCAMRDTLPLNSGVLRCVDIRIPQGILNPNPIGDQVDWPAVAGGNVETSQRVVDVLLGALGLAAASQGTMNNFLFGDAGFGYYETIGGGTGATSEGPGADAVHSHMTNTRLTDVEVLEKKYPVRLVRFEIRKGSGGAGRYSGGCGLVRQVLALKRLDVSLVTSRRNTRPFGLDGGESGASGANWHVLANGEVRPLGSSVQLCIDQGESIRIETPGGGGFGTVLP